MNNNIRVQVLRSIAEIKGVRGVWENMQWHPNADINFYLNIVNSRDNILRPHIMLLYLDNYPKAMIIGRIDNRSLDFKIGYKTILKPKMNVLNIIYGGILGDISDDIASAAVNELIACLKRGEADSVFFSNIKVDSSMCKLARKAPMFLCRDHLRLSNLHWIMTLPKTSEIFYQDMSAHRRHELRRYLRVLDNKYPGSVEIKKYNTVKDVEQICEDAEKIAKKTYHRGLGVGFVYNNENYSRLTLCAQKGWLRAYILYIENNPCAFWIGTLYGKTLYLNFTGYDQSYKKYEPGTCLFIKMVEDLLQAKINEIDFGFGDALYKERFCNGHWEESSLFIFAPSFKGIKLNILRTLVTLISLTAEKTLNQFKLRDKIKKYWRQSRI